MKISNSEVETFLRCRRQWDYASGNRQALRSLSPSPHFAFHVGTIVHATLEAQVSLGRRPDIMGVIDNAEAELEDYYRSIVGVGWSNSERVQLQESRELAFGILTHYFNHYGDVNPLGKDFRYVHAEVTFEVPIPDTEHFLRGTIDGIAQDGEGGIYLVEHKTSSLGFPQDSELQTSRQMQTYVWAARYLLERPVVGIIYDGIAKKVPSVPHVTNRGELSRAPISTTPEIYRQAIKALDFNEADYNEVLEKLSSENKFFKRSIIQFTRRSLDLFTVQLQQLVTDMANPDLPLYPNKQWQGCWDCRYTKLCTAQQMGEDVDTIKELAYKTETNSTAPSRRNVAITHLEI